MHDLYERVTIKMGFRQQKRVMGNRRNLLHEPFGLSKRTLTARTCANLTLICVRHRGHLVLVSQLL